MAAGWFARPRVGVDIVDGDVQRFPEPPGCQAQVPGQDAGLGREPAQRRVRQVPVGRLDGDARRGQARRTAAEGVQDPAVAVDDDGRAGDGCEVGAAAPRAAGLGDPGRGGQVGEEPG
ncbi:hypothetical protein ACRAR1_01465 [Streptomyces sanyensis]|uniref:hypothetical protein n=1 Tax=Streptomyces sanyensis TaxID=568869 RepID=UPI003D78A7C8